MLSDEWKAIILPMCETTEDWIFGIIEVVNHLGWGKWSILELVPQEKLWLRIYNSYESIGYLSMFGKSDSPIEDLSAGVAQAIMNLVYVAKINEQPQLDARLYEQLFGKDKPNYSCKILKSQAMGEKYTEIILQKN